MHNYQCSVSSFGFIVSLFTISECLWPSQPDIYLQMFLSIEGAISSGSNDLKNCRPGSSLGDNSLVKSASGSYHPDKASVRGDLALHWPI